MNPENITNDGYADHGKANFGTLPNMKVTNLQGGDIPGQVNPSQGPSLPLNSPHSPGAPAPISMVQMGPPGPPGLLRPGDLHPGGRSAGEL